MSERPGQRVHRLARYVDEQRIRNAIEAAEANSSARIHVTLSHEALDSTLRAASRVFRHQRLSDTPQRNSVLFYVLPWRREFAVIGDSGIHDKVGQEFWEQIVQAMSAAIVAGDLTDGLVLGIEKAGRELAAHFPVSKT